MTPIIKGAICALSLTLLTACGQPAPTPTPTPALEPTPPPVTATPALADALQEGVTRFLADRDDAQPGGLVFAQSLAIAEFQVDVYRLTYRPHGDGEAQTAYLLYDVGADGQSDPSYTDCAADGDRVERAGLEQAAAESLYHISDLEFSFPRVYSHGYFGLGSSGVDFVGYADWLDQPETVRMENYDVWWPDDYWYETRYDGLTLLCYHSAAENSGFLYKIETTREDLWTYRGAQVGMTKAEILDLYPEINPEEPWGAEWGNHLAYQSNPGALADLYIHFTFDDADVLTKIIMENYFD